MSLLDSRPAVIYPVDDWMGPTVGPGEPVVRWSRATGGTGGTGVGRERPFRARNMREIASRFAWPTEATRDHLHPRSLLMTTTRPVTHARRLCLALGATLALGACATSSGYPPATEPGVPTTPAGTVGTDTTTAHVATPANPTGARSTPGAGTPGSAAQWTASISPMNNSSVRGTATAQVYPTDSTHVSVLVAGGTPGAVYPWHVHTGACGTNGTVLGNPALYQPLKVQGDGTAIGDALVTVRLMPGNEYHVNVHQSMTSMGTIVGCGNLTTR